MSVAAQEIVDEFNATYPVGAPVRYWTGTKDGPGKPSKTRTQARVLGGHTPIVWVEDVAGCLALSHVEPVVGGLS